MSDSRSRWPRATEEKNEILLSALKKAWECGYRKGCDLPGMSEDELSSFLRGNDWWSYDSQEEKSSKLKKTSSGKKLKKITPKKPQLSNDLASAAFNPKFCRARFWNQKDKGDVPVDSAGHGMQCWRSADDDFGSELAVSNSLVERLKALDVAGGGVDKMNASTRRARRD